MGKVSVSPDLLLWACDRSGREYDDLVVKFPSLQSWIYKGGKPTFKQLEKFAKATYTPFGYFFLNKPPERKMPITDYRTIQHLSKVKHSPNLLETIYTMQSRQDWLRDYLIDSGVEPLEFVGSANITDHPHVIARMIQRSLGIESGWACSMKNSKDAVNELRAKIEDIGITAVINGVVGNDTSRKLSVEEFRGFALSDSYAPLIFVNGSDSKSAQIFTLAHELAHIWLGGKGLSSLEFLLPGSSEIEKWCNRCAAEFLVPTVQLKEKWLEFSEKEDRFRKLAKVFKVSPLVISRRSYDLYLIDKNEYLEYYNSYLSDEWIKKKVTISGSKGGNFYNTQNTRIGKKFFINVLYAAQEGKIGFKEAHELTGLYGGSFQGYANHLKLELP